MKRYLWDTTTFSDVVKGVEAVRVRYRSIAPDQVAISVITLAEVRYGLEKRPEATRYASIAAELIKTIAILPWTAKLASFYASLRLHAASAGVTVGANDLLIATHSYAAGRILVTSDEGLSRLAPWITIENWRSSEGVYV